MHTIESIVNLNKYSDMLYVIRDYNHMVISDSTGTTYVHRITDKINDFYYTNKERLHVGNNMRTKQRWGKFF